MRQPAGARVSTINSALAMSSAFPRYSPLRTLVDAAHARIALDPHAQLPGLAAPCLEKGDVSRQMVAAILLMGLDVPDLCRGSPTLGVST
jgi:hypothetical protein